MAYSLTGIYYTYANESSLSTFKISVPFLSVMSSMGINGGLNIAGSRASTLASLTVSDMVGNTTAIFGTDRPICMVAGTGAIGFNTYYNNGWKRYTANAHTGVINMDALGSGRIFFQHFGIGADTTSALTATESLSLFPSGNVSIGNATDNGYKLYVAGNMQIYSAPEPITDGSYTNASLVLRVTNGNSPCVSFWRNGYSDAITLYHQDMTRANWLMSIVTGKQIGRAHV